LPSRLSSTMPQARWLSSKRLAGVGLTDDVDEPMWEDDSNAPRPEVGPQLNTASLSSSPEAHDLRCVEPAEASTSVSADPASASRNTCSGGMHSSGSEGEITHRSSSSEAPDDFCGEGCEQENGGLSTGSDSLCVICVDRSGSEIADLSTVSDATCVPRMEGSTKRQNDDVLFKESEIAKASSSASDAPWNGFMDFAEGFEEIVEDSRACSTSRQQVRCVTYAAHFSSTEPAAAAGIPASEASQLHWQLCDEVIDEGAVVVHAPNYFTVCFADRIPEETGAAKVHHSRLETGRQWHNFLRYGTEPELRGELALDCMLECPCCLGILRRPVALPCGHSLCRSCLTRLPFSSAGTRSCPLCRSTIPHIYLHVNEPLDAVTEALRRAQNLVRPQAHHPPCVMSSSDYRWQEERSTSTAAI